ncbi:EIF2B3 [Bugula neritina]|uniref:Translation initiation factor eIF2B subunit gamma n=1 Tax=Bugula neritina TaxID=10212 RepID=A0A7J7JZP8_BUGNE|nr:EIF2B3 [Bugula neritina]
MATTTIKFNGHETGSLPLKLMNFQPVLLAAGRGERLAPVSDKTPKCLIPIGNVPMLWYPLRSLDLAGFSDVLIVILKSYESKISSALDHMQKKVPWKTEGFHYKFHSIVENIGEEEGTATSLLNIASVRKNDLLVISCDLITDVPLKSLIEKHTLHRATLTCLMKKLSKPEGALPGVRSKAIAKENNVVGIDEKSDGLLFIYAAADHKDHINLTQTMLTRYPRMLLTSQLEDCHLYCISREALLSVPHATNCHSLRTELIPHLLTHQYTPGDFSIDEDKLSMDLVTKLSSWTDHTGDMHGPYHDTKTRCYVHVAESHNLCLRSNTVPDFYEANKQIGAYTQHFGLGSFHKIPEGLKRSQAGNDSMLGDRLNMGDKSSIKKSMIGSCCEIGDKVKINNCIIMDNVKIKDSCVLQTCIICENSIIDEKAELKECIIGAKQTVPTGKMTNEVLADDEDEFI